MIMRAEEPRLFDFKSCVLPSLGEIHQRTLFHFVCFDSSYLSKISFYVIMSIAPTFPLRYDLDDGMTCAHLVC